MPRLLLCAVALLIALGLQGRAHAQADFVGTRAIGMGEAHRAIAVGSEAILLNPSGMSLVNSYSLEAQYGFSIEDLGHRLMLSVVDSVTSRVAAGLFYTYINTSPKVGFDWAGGRIGSERIGRSGHATGLSVSLPLGQIFTVGASIKYLNFDTVAPLPEGTVPKELKLDTINGVTFDVGVTARFANKFNVALVGQNLWDHGSTETPLTLGIGLALIPTRNLAITFDTAVNFTGHRSYSVDMATGKLNTSIRIGARVGPGIEWTIASKVPLRAGVVYDSALVATYLTAGLGYVYTTAGAANRTSQYGIDLSYRGKVQGGVDNLLILGIRIVQ